MQEISSGADTFSTRNFAIEKTVREMKGTITTIQRMSIHDGPGIRSTLFLKGCDLRCAWCHNPETWSARPQLQYVAGKCIGCGSCIAVCEARALRFAEKVMVDRSHCTQCGRCVEVCVTGAMSWVGRQIEAEEAVRELLLDRTFFEESGGGVTLSGGEPLLQADFAEEVLRGCLAEGVHTAVESNLTEPWPTIERFLPLVRLWMCDLKVADSAKHRRWTGLGNERIVENLHRLAATGTPLIVRTPVVPGVNDTPEAVEALCRVVAGLNGRVAYELLGFHSLGFGKFDDLGMDNPLAGTPPLAPEKLADLQRIPERFGLKRKF